MSAVTALVADELTSLCFGLGYALEIRHEDYDRTVALVVSAGVDVMPPARLYLPGRDGPVLRWLAARALRVDRVMFEALSSDEERRNVLMLGLDTTVQALERKRRMHTRLGQTLASLEMEFCA